MTPQHPAAPETETDTNGLTEADLTVADTPFSVDGQPVFTQAAVERILADRATAARERVRVVEDERDFWKAEREVLLQQQPFRVAESNRLRAESAEAAHEAEKAAHERTVAGVRAWCAANEIAEPPLDWVGLGEFLDRTLLGGGGAR